MTDIFKNDGHAALVVSEKPNINNIGNIWIQKYYDIQSNAKADSKMLQSCLIQQVMYNGEVAMQAEPTLSGNIYVSVFGDKATMYTISGIAFDVRPCDDKTEQMGDPATGILRFYKEYRLNSARGTDIKQQITVTTYNTVYGTSVGYVGILTAMTLHTAISPDGIRKYNFTFTFLSLV